FSRDWSSDVCSSDLDRLEDLARLTVAEAVADLLHQRLGPGVVGVRGAGRDPVEPVFAVVARVGRVLTRERGELLGAEVAPAAPRLIADAEEADIPRVRVAVLGAQSGHRGVAGAGEVLDPVARLLHRARA